MSLALPQAASVGAAIKIPFNPANFSNPLNIDNEFFPLVVGTTTVFRA